MPLAGGVGFDEELHLHLLELAGAEDEVARVISLRKLLPIWPMPNGGFLRDVVTTLAVDEDALRRLRAQMVQTLLGLDRAEVRLEHHVEVARSVHWPLVPQSGQVMSAIGTDSGSEALPSRPLFQVGLLQVVLAVPLVAVQALDERVVEHLDVAGGHPPRGQDDRAVQADDVVTAGDHRFPPLPFDVLLSSTPSGP